MRTRQVSELSVFFPAYNEEANLEKTVKAAVLVLKKIAKKWEVIIINDGSSDRTGKIAESLSRQDDRIRVISHKSNKGYGEALKSGFSDAKYPWVAFIDSDGQFDFSEIKIFLPQIKVADLILGYRIKRADPFIRRIYGFVWSVIARVLLGVTARDYSCGFKLIKKEVFEAVQPLEAGEKVTQIEMLVKAKKLGFKFYEVGVHHYPRKFGQQTGANVVVTLKSILDLFKLWWKLANKIEFFWLFLILAVAAFLRFYRLPEYMTFLGDEGRDAIVVRRLLVNFDPILIGPGTSIGNMYLGPLYYYMMAPALFIAGLSPVGPAAQIATLGVITVWFVWKISREWFPSARASTELSRTSSGQVSVAAVVAASLYAVSPVVITYSRSSWNPNIMPFFALLSIYSLWRVWKYHQWKWLVVLGISYAFVLQSHYLGLLLAPTIGLFWLLSMKSVWNDSKQKLYAIRHTLISVALFVLLMSPLIIFDARHGWRNFEAMRIFFAERQTTVSALPWNALPNLWPIWEEKVVTRLMGGMNETVGTVVAAILFIGTITYFVARQKPAPLALLVIWILVGIGGLGLYKQEIYDHYFGFMFPAPFLLLGALTESVRNLFKQPLLYHILIYDILAALIIVNLIENPLKYPPNRQFQRTEEVAEKIAQESGGKPFNLAVLAERNYEDAYQYFLEWWRYPVRDIDPLRFKETVAEQLFVVCEFSDFKKCDPTHSPKAEIANFGWSKIENEWGVAGVGVFKLVHSIP